MESRPVTQTVIDQNSALTIGFGEVLRSSAIFYVRQSERFQTTITFMNYWLEKRGLDVAIIASTEANPFASPTFESRAGVSRVTNW